VTHENFKIVAGDFNGVKRFQLIRAQETDDRQEMNYPDDKQQSCDASINQISTCLIYGNTGVNVYCNTMPINMIMPM